MKDIEFTVEYNKKLTDSVFELKLICDEPLPNILGGQFLHLKLNDNSLLLRRPFCIYKADLNSVTLVIAKVGKGTTGLSKITKGEKLMAILPIGNGFILEEKYKRIALLGGGVGCAPLLSVPLFYKGTDKEFRAYLGFADKSSVILEEDFKNTCRTLISTDDGSYGFKGYVTDAFLSELDEFKPDVILCCGSENMIKGVQKVALSKNIPGFMSGEARMGCGIGACLVCACKVKGANGAYHNERACVDGPVFRLEDIIL